VSNASPPLLSPCVQADENAIIVDCDMQNESWDERRQHDRADIEATVICRGERGGAVVSFDAENVSLGGILVRSGVVLQPGQRVTLELELPVGFVPMGPGALRLEGEVTRTDSTQDGARGIDLAIRFVELSEEHEDLLAKYIRRKNLMARR
jgi:hypothetical protein